MSKQPTYISSKVDGFVIEIQPYRRKFMVANLFTNDKSKKLVKFAFKAYNWEQPRVNQAIELGEWAIYGWNHKIISAERIRDGAVPMWIVNFNKTVLVVKESDSKRLLSALTLSNLTIRIHAK